jgi:uncharacterized protein YcbK (DUF882 family)
MGLRASAVAAAALVAFTTLRPTPAHADIQHTVARGHTVEAIANRYHVTAKAIVEANHLKDVKHLRIGEVLTIPGVKAASEKSDSPAARTKPEERGDKKKPAEAREDHGKKGEKTAKAGKATGRETTTFAMKPKTPGVVHVHRIATTESFDIQVASKKGRVSPTALKSFEKMMRSPAGMAHPVDARLVALLGIVSNHFGSRKIEVISGFRPFTPTQHNPHSNHMHGKAIDFRVAGVPNEALRDFCRTLKNVGCGYYPSSVFVHMDVRDQSAFWIDYSKPGETPRYNAPNTDADEGTSDVHAEAPPSSDEPAAAATAPATIPTPTPATIPTPTPATIPTPTPATIPTPTPATIPTPTPAASGASETAP